MKKIYAYLVIIFISTSSFAGLHALTHHSRANCINNESVSWQLGHRYWLYVSSNHMLTSSHTIYTGWVFTWRAAAIHWGEGRGHLWAVYGEHWMKDPNNKPMKVASEYVTDCSIYDGWWDH